MKKAAILLSLALVCPGLLPGQEPAPEKSEIPPAGGKVQSAPASPAKKRRGTNKKSNRFANLFYRAFYLQHGENRAAPAEKLYREYLEKAGKEGRFAPRAARELASILEARGDRDEAEKIRKTYTRPDRTRRAGRRRLPPGEGGASRRAWTARTGKVLAAMKARLKKMEESGASPDQIETLRRRIESLSRLLDRVESGEIPPPRGRSFRGGRRPDLSRMDPDRRDSLLERILENARRMAERLEEKGNEEASKKILGLCSRLEEAVQKEDWEEAGRILQELRPLRRRRSLAPGESGRGRRRGGRAFPPGGGGTPFRRAGKAGGEGTGGGGR